MIPMPCLCQNLNKCVIWWVKADPWFVLDNKKIKEIDKIQSIYFIDLHKYNKPACILILSISIYNKVHSPYFDWKHAPIDCAHFLDQSLQKNSSLKCVYMYWYAHILVRYIYTYI